MALEHQDWTPVVFRKRQEDAEQKQHQKRISQQRPQQERRLDEETEVFHIPKFEKTFIQQVLQARLAKQWTQKDLAMALKESIQRIQSFEQGKEVYDPALKARMQRLLFSKTRG